MLSNARLAASALVLPLILGAASLLAEESDEAKKCIQINRISSVDVIDNQNVKFKVTGGPDYINTIPNKCPGLSKHDPIMYKTSLSQLCDLDTITVLHSIGGGFSRGASCGLGKFVPVEEDEARSGE